MKKVSILSIDGGGIRGILPGTILTHLEKLLQKKSDRELKIGDYFDFVAGTSTGGILSCIYLVPDENGKAKYSAEDALNLYLKNGQAIFNRSLLHKVTSAGGILHEKFSEDALYTLLTQYLGDETLDRLIKPCLITSYEIADRRSFFFTSADAGEDPMYNFKVRDVARATSAAPTYFEPAHIESLDGRLYSLVDGGVFANNPALCAYAEARKINFSQIFKDNEKPDKPSAKDMVIVSIGTGSVQKPYYYKNFKDAGQIKWLEPIIDILMSGNSETVHYQLKQMYLTLEAKDQQDYYRLEPGLREACSEMDDATPENLTNLHQAGLAFIHDNAQLLDKLADKVLENCK